MVVKCVPYMVGLEV